MVTRDNREFRAGIHELGYWIGQLDSPYDRVRVCEWARRLAESPSDTVESAKRRNEYLQLLLVQARGGIIHGLFQAPPATPNDSRGALPPLTEALGNLMNQLHPTLPRAGPISPFFLHKSKDGRAYISAKQIPGGGVFCYMAVSPEGML